MMIYIATSLKRMHAHGMIKKSLLDAGHTITYDWTTHGSVKHVSLERLQEVAEVELKGIKDADAVVVLLPGGKGTHSELGIAIALEKPLIIHSETPSPFELGEENCAYYNLEGIQRIHCPLEEFAEKVHDLLPLLTN